MSDIHNTITPNFLRDTSDGTITYFGEFNDRAKEKAFRADTLKGDTNIARMMILLFAIPIAVLLFNDYLLQGGGMDFWETAGFRLAILGFSVVVWQMLRTRSYREWDRWLISLTGSVLVFDLYITSIRPVGYVGPLLANLLVALCCYLVVPLRLKYQLVLGVSSSVLQLVFSIWIKPVGDFPTKSSIVMTFLLANVVGFLASRQLNHSKRLQFAVREKLVDSERDYRTLVDASGSMVWSMNNDKSVDFVNFPLIEMTGRGASRDQAFDWSAIIHPDDASEFITQMGASLARGEKYETVTRMLRRDGEYRWTLKRMIPFQREGTPVIKWIGTSTDIHEHWQNKLRLMESNSQLEAALGRVKQLEDILPICSFCKKIKDDTRGWQPLDVYISAHSHTKFSHGICDSCGKEHYGELGEGFFGGDASD